VDLALLALALASVTIINILLFVDRIGVRSSSVDNDRWVAEALLGTTVCDSCVIFHRSVNFTYLLTITRSSVVARVLVVAVIITRGQSDLAKAEPNDSRAVKLSLVAQQTDERTD